MPISTHVLDTSRGHPAADVGVSLARLESNKWVPLGSGSTDADGRSGDLLPAGIDITPGVYRIRFDIESYFERIAVESLYPFVEIAFRATANQHHYHIPLLLAAYGYSTYRGS